MISHACIRYLVHLPHVALTRLRCILYSFILMTYLGLHFKSVTIYEQALFPDMNKLPKYLIPFSYFITHVITVQILKAFSSIAYMVQITAALFFVNFKKIILMCLVDNSWVFFQLFTKLWSNFTASYRRHFQVASFLFLNCA